MKQSESVERRPASASIKRDLQKRNSANRDSRASLGATAAVADKRNSDHLSSPQGRHSLQYSSFRLPSSDETEKFCNKHAQPAKKYLDSGKSSDSSSLSSRHGYRKLQEGGSLRVAGQNQTRRPAGDNFRLLQESSSSHNIPHIALPTDRRSKEAVTKHQSFDMLEGNGSGSGGGGGNSSSGKTSRSLTRSGSFMNSPSRQQAAAVPNSNFQRRGSGGSDDSMHEKYFKSVENTPVTRRKQHQPATAVPVKQKHSSDSSPQSPISPPKAAVAVSAPTQQTQVQSQQQKCVVRPSQLVIEAPSFSYSKSSTSSQPRQQHNSLEYESRKKSAER